MFAAITAGNREKKVLVIEHAEKIGKKILISGGGRCNFTNKNASWENFISENKNFCRSALSNYTPQDFISLVEKHKIDHYEKKLGQLFCTGSSREIVTMLEEECKTAEVKILVNCKATSISKPDKFSVETNLGVFTSDSLVVACGGASIPKMGASKFGYELAKKFGHSITSIKPALVPLTFSGKEKEFCNELAGISVPAIASTMDNKINFEENILFTHRGLSGPAILQISSYLNEGNSFKLDISNGFDMTEAIAENPKAELKTSLSKMFSSRFVELFLKTYYDTRSKAGALERGEKKPLNQYSKKEIETFNLLLKNWTLTPTGTEGFEKAEVTAGGVDTKELSSKTMESQKVSGLFFIGEVVDVTGWLGGYNFQWAWSSGFACGTAV